jgi:nucleotide-binding universal stress UspA family protein
MKTILLPAEPGDQLATTLQLASQLGARFGSTIEGVALRPAFAEVVAPDPIVAVSIPPQDWDESVYVRQARAAFDAYAAAHTGGPTLRWRGGRAIEDSALGSLARLYDVTVMARPGGKGSRMTAFEAALFDSGRPLLMAPPRALPTFGDQILIHWNCSTETARVIALGMPLLQKARKVLLLTVEGNTVPGPAAREALGALEAQGVHATEKTVPAGRGPGETILAEAKAFGADLILKGAYTQSRLRQMIFGGATSHLLAAAELPVFLSH